jgi:hypothetical protein
MQILSDLGANSNLVIHTRMLGASHSNISGLPTSALIVAMAAVLKKTPKEVAFLLYEVSFQR